RRRGGGHRHPPGAVGVVPDLPGNRGLAAGGGGDRVSQANHAPAKPANSAATRPERRPGPHMGPPRGGPHAMTMPVERAKDFHGTLRQLLKYLRPHLGTLVLVGILAAASTLFGVISPRVLGHATTVIFDGFMARLQGVPGAGVDFGALTPAVASSLALRRLARPRRDPERGHVRRRLYLRHAAVDHHAGDHVRRDAGGRAGDDAQDASVAAANRPAVAAGRGRAHVSGGPPV